MDNTTTGWTAKTVAQAVLVSGKTRHKVAIEAAISPRTFDRKLRGGTDFTWEELLRIAEVLGISPTTFTPPPFRERVAV